MSTERRPRRVRRSLRWPVVLVLVALASLVVLVLVVIAQGPDRTATGTITDLQPHRVCVSDAGGPALCFDADSPQRLVGFAVGDCVRLRYSPDQILVAIHRLAEGCAES